MESGAEALERRTIFLSLLVSFLVVTTGLSTYQDRIGVFPPRQQERDHDLPQEPEATEIYSLVVHHVYSHNSFSPETEWPAIFIDPTAQNMSGRRVVQPEGRPIRSSLIEKLMALPAKKIAFASRDEAIDPRRLVVREGGCFITLGVIRLLGEGKAEVEAEHYVGGTGASGHIYVLTKNLAGKWRIEEAAMLRVA